jgi:CheY-like chemotaxis protein
MGKTTQERRRLRTDANASIAEETEEGAGESFEASLGHGLRAAAPRILVAEDDEQMRDLIALMLRLEGALVLEASDGWQLIERIEALEQDGREPDLVITDVRMPGVTGLEALAALEASAWRIPFVVISAFGGRDVHERAFALGAHAVLDKPFTLDALRDTVRRILRARSFFREEPPSPSPPRPAGRAGHA